MSSIKYTASIRITVHVCWVSYSHETVVRMEAVQESWGKCREESLGKSREESVGQTPVDILEGIPEKIASVLRGIPGKVTIDRYRKS